jgi:hypothetical protein
MLRNESIHIRIPPELKRAIEAASARFDVSISALLVSAISEYLTKSISRDRVFLSLPKFLEFYENLFANKREFEKIQPSETTEKIPEKFKKLFVE